VTEQIFLQNLTDNGGVILSHWNLETKGPYVQKINDLINCPRFHGDTVDGRNPAPVGIWFIPF
jgi:hypothetical protein